MLQLLNGGLLGDTCVCIVAQDGFRKTYRQERLSHSRELYTYADFLWLEKQPRKERLIRQCDYTCRGSDNPNIEVAHT